jgi:hypothetical protein
MSGQRAKWRLADVVDLEALLSGEGRPVVGREDRAEVGRVLRGTSEWSALGRRRVGLRAWLELRRGDREVGRKAVDGLRLVSWGFGMAALLGGMGVVRGLLAPVDGLGLAYNIWVFLAVTVGVQILILGLGCLGYVLVRRQRGRMTLLQRLAGRMACRLAGGINGDLWRRITTSGRGYGSAVTWRLGRISQGVALGFNLGVLAGFLGCLWFLGVSFYWQSTLMNPQTVSEWFDAIASPWSWSGWGLPKEWSEEDFSVLEGRFYEVQGGREWWPFLMMTVLVWGLLPRLLLWLGCVIGERRALASLDFQEPRHRELWRQLTRVERSMPTEGPADGVVLLDVGGTGVETARLREFLLREMRVNPEGRYEAAVLDEEAEAEAWAAIRKAPLGVVYLVEGWALSPKEMAAIHARVREHGEDRLVRFLVFGGVRDGMPEAPADAEFAQWKEFVDGLRDPAAEVVAYEVPEPVMEAE